MKVAKFWACKEKVSVICLYTKELVEYVKNLHNLTNTTTIAMGRFLTISSLMAHTEIKEKTDKITVQLNGGGLTGSLISVIRIDGKKAILKGYIQNPNVETPLNCKGDIDISRAIGSTGYLNIIKDNVFTKQGYKGLSPLVSGDITSDFAHYYTTSNQKSTYLDADVLLKDNEILGSCGYMINLMPDATEEDYYQIENSLKKAPSILEMLEQNKSLEEIAKIITGDNDITIIEDDLSVVYECDCSREKTEEALISIGKDELNKIILEDGKANIICHYCNKSYDFTKEDLENIIKEIK